MRNFVQKEPQKMTKRLTGSPLLATTLNLGSIFGFVPFKICVDSKTQLYYIAPIYFIRKVRKDFFENLLP